MAYPAVNSLIQTLELIQTTYPALIHGQVAEMFSSLRASAEYFQNILENTILQKHEHEKIKDLEGGMIAAVQQAEYLLESNFVEVMIARSNQQEEEGIDSNLTIQDEAVIQLRGLPQAIDKIDALRKDLALVESSISTINANVADEEHFLKTRDSSSPKRASMLLQDATVGLEDALMEITDRLLRSASEREVIPILGMGGCGKTTLAKKALDDPSIKSRFGTQAWVTISQEYNLTEVLLSLVRSVTGNASQEMTDDKLMEVAYRALKGQKYLIVIDDIWSTEIWDLMARILPDNRNGSRIILTTRLKEVAEYANPDIPPHEMMLLSLDESWKLLCIKLFGAKHTCPSELKEIGKKIVGKCQGLPLAILVIAGHLSKVPMTKESWAAVAINVSQVVTSYPNECLAILAMSYHHLPIHLKPCFLHIGIFPEDSDINIHRLIQLWVAERFLKVDRLKSPEEVAEDCLEDLISRNLIMVRRRKSNGKMKSCGIHDLLRDLSVSEAQKEKFLHVIRTNQGSTNFLAKNHQSPRFSSHTTISLENFSTSSQVMRSLYLFGEPHIPAKTTLQLKALRVLSVIPSFKFRSYPNITLNSAILRYLEITSDNHFPESLTFMYNLQTFIFWHGELGFGEILLLPREIWNMKQLKHLCIGNSTYLPNPPSMSRTDREHSSCDLGLQKLEELSSLCLASCTKEVFNALPNLRKLKIYDTGKKIEGFEDTYRSLLNLVYLNKLQVLKCSFNGDLPLQLRLADWCSFPTSLKSLSLYGSDLQCTDATTLSKLPDLEVLKLRYSALLSKNPDWVLTDEDRFHQLKFLMIDNVYIRKWEASSVNFPNLRRLVLQKMCGLQIPRGILDICTLESIELYKCLVSANEAKEIQDEAAAMAGYDCLLVRTYNTKTYFQVKQRL